MAPKACRRALPFLGHGLWIRAVLGLKFDWLLKAFTDFHVLCVEVPGFEVWGLESEGLMSSGNSSQFHKPVTCLSLKVRLHAPQPSTSTYELRVRASPSNLHPDPSLQIGMQSPGCLLAECSNSHRRVSKAYNSQNPKPASFAPFGTSPRHGSQKTFEAKARVRLAAKALQAH